MNPEISFEAIDHLIQGKMIACALNLSVDQVMYDKNVIRHKLASEIAQYMIDNKLIEFTQQRNSFDLGLTVRARVFVTPDDTVKIIRTMKR